MLVIETVVLAYVALTMYAGFWYALSQIPDKMPTGDKLLWIWLAAIVMPVAIPLGIVVGIYRMLIGVTIVLHVDRVENDGWVTDCRTDRRTFPDRRT